MGHAAHLKRALELARPHRTHPNPRVGCVLVDNVGNVVGEGSHQGPGTDHAEIAALKVAGNRARSSTLYVTLEPCTHHGRTPPCVEAIVDAGVSVVVIGAIDPDVRVSGAGVRHLENAGIEVVQGLAGAEFESVDEGYFHQRRTGLPLVTLKYAMTLDGSVAAADGSARWISGEDSRADAHLLRSQMDAIVVGAGTFRADDPKLDARTDEPSHQPRPVVVAGRSELPPEAQLWDRDPLVIATHALDVDQGEVVVVDGENGIPDPTSAARALAELDYYDVMVEGGPTLAASWWQAGVISRGVVYVAGRIGGGSGVPPLAGVFANIGDARTVNVRNVRQTGGDVRIEFD